MHRETALAEIVAGVRCDLEDVEVFKVAVLSGAPELVLTTRFNAIAGRATGFALAAAGALVVAMGAEAGAVLTAAQGTAAAIAVETGLGILIVGCATVTAYFVRSARRTERKMLTLIRAVRLTE
jgi:hypothetical protein